MTERVMPRGFVPIFRRARAENRKRVRLLRRRVELLRDLEQPTSWEQAEATAIEWATDLAEAWMAEDPIIDVPFDFNGSLDEWIRLLGTRTHCDGQPCEVVGVHPQDRRLALRIDDGTRPVKDGPLSGKQFVRERTADDAGTL